MRDDEKADVDSLVDELFREVETSQGHFHVSDGETYATRAQFFERVRGRMQHGQEAVRKMRRFLRRHGELQGSVHKAHRVRRRVRDRE